MRELFAKSNIIDEICILRRAQDEFRTFSKLL